MKGLMQQTPLTLDLILGRAIALGAGRDVVSATPRGVVRHPWREVGHRAARLAAMLDELGVAAGERVASFAWNSHRHVELHLGVPCAGRVLHPVNLRLSDEHIEYLVAKAGDQIAFIDALLTPQIAPLRHRLPIRQWVVMEDGTEIDESFSDCPRYEELLAAATRDPQSPQLAEDDAAWICSTSGTTGKPKLVVTSHRSVYLHTLGALMVDSHGISREDTVLPATPMFHVAAWGAPYTCAYAPATLVLPGRDTSPHALARLIQSERVTVAFGVPTLWIQLESVCDQGHYDLSSLKTIQSGGASSTRALIERYARRGVQYVQSWGMTEMSPCGTSSRVAPTANGSEDRRPVTEVGPPSPGVELRLVGDDGVPLPWDRVSVGELEARGPWVIRAYLDPDDDANQTRFHDGWLRTEDLARIGPDGTVQIVDRAKDLIKSGGEWISSLDLERALADHPDVGEVAVVAIADERWGERPLAVVIPAGGRTPDPEQLREFLGDRVPRWWIPERVLISDEIPKTTVGKYDKRALRARLAAEPVPR
jgi:fatty-acyl-CoA synthase